MSTQSTLYSQVVQAGGDDSYGLPILHPDQALPTAYMLDISTLDNTVVDANGILIPGTVLRETSAGSGILTLIDAGSQTLFGLVYTRIRVALDNETATLAAAADFPIVVATQGTINRQIVEDNLQRALTANELTAIGNNNNFRLLLA
jgi:hypothetical protein